MEISFGQNQTPVADPTQNAVVVADANPVPATTTDASGGFLAADHLPGFKDIILPRLNLVQGVGELKDSFAQGSIVFGQSLEVFRLPQIEKATGNIKLAGTPLLNVTIIAFRPTRFAEKVSGGARGIIVNTEEQVRAAGGTTDYNEWNLKKAAGMKRFEPLVDAFVVIKRPDHVADDDTVFTFKVGDAKYALALWSMKGSSYTQCAKKVFFTARRMGCLSVGGYPSWSFDIGTRTAETAGNTYYVPTAKPHAPSTPEMLAFINNILGVAPANAQLAAASSPTALPPAN